MSETDWVEPFVTSPTGNPRARVGIAEGNIVVALECRPHSITEPVIEKMVYVKEGPDDPLDNLDHLSVYVPPMRYRVERQLTPLEALTLAAQIVQTVVEDASRRARGGR